MKNPGVCSTPEFSPHFQINQVDKLLLQQYLIENFQQWGLPRGIKVDNGAPFGDPQRTSVPVLALWIIALGIEMIWNRPRHPRDNAKVERMQGTTKRWVELEKCQHREELQEKLDQAAVIQREKYPVSRLGFKNRKEVYPALWANTRTYQAKDFNIDKVHQYLSQVVFIRKVNKIGLINFYAQSVYVSVSQRRKTVSLTFDLEKKQWKVYDENNQQIGWLNASNFSNEHVVNLSVCQYKYVRCQNLMSQ